MTDRENLLRTIYFEKPDHIPMTFHINGSCWHHYPHNALKDLMASHPLLFPDFEYNPDPVKSIIPHMLKRITLLPIHGVVYGKPPMMALSVQ